MLIFGYQPTLYLMPTPVAISAGDRNPFDLNPDQKKSNKSE